jgi:hypothetical protein
LLYNSFEGQKDSDISKLTVERKVNFTFTCERVNQPLFQNVPLSNHENYENHLDLTFQRETFFKDILESSSNINQSYIDDLISFHFIFIMKIICIFLFT